MARKLEFIKKSEARIIVYLVSADRYMRNGTRMADKLKIDYIYLMKLLKEMFEKGWVGTHKYNNIIYFTLTDKSPIKYAMDKLIDGQIKLGEL